MSRWRKDKEKLNELTDREYQVLVLVKRGKTSTEIAEALGITRSTVDNFIGKLLKKQGVSSRTELK